MFKVNTSTGKITMHRGDTGDATYKLHGYSFNEGDKVVWTLATTRGEVIRQVLCVPVDNRITVHFSNSDTDQLAAGMYNYDIRVVQNPTYDETDSSKIVDGEVVSTPVISGSTKPMVLEVMAVIGQI